MTIDEVARIREALGEARGRPVSHAELAAIVGIANAEESSPLSGAAEVALRYLSQGLPGFRGALPEWSFQAPYHQFGSSRWADYITRHWWPRMIVKVTRPIGGRGKINEVRCAVLEKCRNSFFLDA